ncbi:MAG: hypothetical protein ACYTEQ_05800 [Planctomycetota bacterium]
MQAYRIVNWASQFEVDSQGHATKLHQPAPPVEQLRKSPLPYIRITGDGRSVTNTEKRIIKKAWRAGQLMEAAVDGVYHRLLKIAGNQPRELRGWILTEYPDSRPMYAREIAECMGVEDAAGIRCVEFVLGVLCDPEVRRLELCEFGQTCADLRNAPEVCALFKTETEGSNSNTEKASGLNNHPSDSVKSQLLPMDKNVRTPPEEAVDRPAGETLLRLKRFFRVADQTQRQANETMLTDAVLQIRQAVSEGRLDNQIWDRLVRDAQECQEAKKPIAVFAWRLQREPYGYKPAGKIPALGTLTRRLAAKIGIVMVLCAVLFGCRAAGPPVTNRPRQRPDKVMRQFYDQLCKPYWWAGYCRGWMQLATNYGLAVEPPDCNGL